MKDEIKRNNCLELLNLCGFKLDDLPIEAWNILKQINPVEIATPLVKHHFNEGKTAKQLATKYRLKMAQVKYILYEKQKRV